ncbi:MAG: hypothetical protein CHACPFDD_03502 [Phycisphaerae bacterium]|nr:hypothetical protein [Phycisphaerae bacterium]
MSTAELLAPHPSAPALPPHLQSAMAKVTEISALPEITVKIMDVVEDPKASAHDMHDIVKNDPALAAKILKVVNSAFYGLPSQISSLDRAIVMLGLSAVKNIALAASLSRMFTPQPISEHFAPKDLWTHSISVGVCAKLLAKAGGRDFAEEAFVAGLVHDMGLLVEHQLFPDKLRTIAVRCHSEPLNFCQVEAEVIGADHPTFGAALAAKWKFPPGLRSAIGYHHDPSHLKPELRKLTTYVNIADVLCCQARYGFWLTAQTQAVTEEMLESIGLTPATLADLTAKLPELVAEASSVFGEQ